MKKSILLLCAVLMAFCFNACDDDETPPEYTTPTQLAAPKDFHVSDSVKGEISWTGDENAIAYRFYNDQFGVSYTDITDTKATITTFDDWVTVKVQAIAKAKSKYSDSDKVDFNFIILKNKSLLDQVSNLEYAITEELVDDRCKVVFNWTKVSHADSYIVTVLSVNSDDNSTSVFQTSYTVKVNNTMERPVSLKKGQEYIVEVQAIVGAEKDKYVTNKARGFKLMINKE